MKKLGSLLRAILIPVLVTAVMPHFAPSHALWAQNTATIGVSAVVVRAPSQPDFTDLSEVRSFQLKWGAKVLANREATPTEPRRVTIAYAAN